MALILPCLYSELEGPALKGILEALKVPYLSKIVIGLDRADESQYRHALEYFASPASCGALERWPRLQSLMQAMRSKELAPDQLGKGCNV